MKKIKWLLPAAAAAGLLLVSCSPANRPVNGGENAARDASQQESGNASLPASQGEATRVKVAEQGGAQEKMPAQSVKLAKGEFSASRNAKGELVAVPAGLADYSIDYEAVVELEGQTLVMANVFYGDDDVIKVLLSHKTGEDQVKTVWSEGITDTNNRWYNTFIGQLLVKADEERVLFLEPEIIGQGGKYHLSEYNVRTGKIARIREDFWPLPEEYDYIYQYHWDGERMKIFLQSYLGLVRVFDLQGGKDDAPDRLFRVIPHSTTGAPSLFLSPDFERFAHDDESGKVTFYDIKSAALGKIKLSEDKYVPSEKIKWNPSGSIAWMESSPGEHSRIKDIDIDYLSIAPQRIDFYGRDGGALGSIKADAGDDRALDIAGWLDDSTALVKSYRFEPDGSNTYGMAEKEPAYFYYEMFTRKKNGPRARRICRKCSRQRRARHGREWQNRIRQSRKPGSLQNGKKSCFLKSPSTYF